MRVNQANKKDVRDKLSRLFLYQIQGEKPIQPAVNCLLFLGHKKWEAVHMQVIIILQRVSVGF